MHQKALAQTCGQTKLSGSEIPILSITYLKEGNKFLSTPLKKVISICIMTQAKLKNSLSK